MDFLYVSSHWQLILLALSQISWLKRSLTWGFQHKVVMMSLSHSLPAREDPSGRWWYSQRRWSPSSGWRWSRCRTRWWPPRRCTCSCRPPAQHTWFISRSGRSFDFYKQCREENARETSCQNNLSHLSDNKLSVTFVTLNLGTDFPLGTLYSYECCLLYASAHFHMTSKWRWNFLCEAHRMIHMAEWGWSVELIKFKQSLRLTKFSRVDAAIFGGPSHHLPASRP